MFVVSTSSHGSRETKSALEDFPGDGCQLLERRVQNLQSAFSRSFLQFADRSRSLRAATFSDSVFAQWSDYKEGIRFVIPFAEFLWLALDHSLLRFRGFVDSGPAISEKDGIAHAMNHTDSRFIQVFPTSIALWSVAVAEASHFPDGIFGGRKMAADLPKSNCKPEVLKAAGFEYHQFVLPDGVNRE